MAKTANIKQEIIGYMLAGIILLWGFVVFIIGPLIISKDFGATASVGYFVTLLILLWIGSKIIEYIQKSKNKTVQKYKNYLFGIIYLFFLTVAINIILLIVA